MKKCLCFLVLSFITIAVVKPNVERDIIDYDKNIYINHYAKSLKEVEENNQSKMCRFRDEGLFPVKFWNWKVGEGCYKYYPSDWFSKKIKIGRQNLEHNNVIYQIPIGMIDEKLIAFDYTNPMWSRQIQHSFKDNKLYLKWVNCARTGDLCCNQNMNDHNIHPSYEYSCPAVWDAWTCFMPAQKNSSTELPCPDYTSSSDETPCILYSQKECLANGTWNHHTEYGTCASAPIYRRRHRFNVVVLYVSIALSLPAVIIFASYQNLRILRVNLHRNLLIVCILRNVLTILSKELLLLDSLQASSETHNTMEENGVGCRILSYLNGVAANAIYACMFADGFYLHKLIVRIFSKDPNVYVIYGMVVVLSLVPTTIWAIFMAVQADEYCWVVDNAWYQWIPDGFRIVILSANVLLLLDIIRVLLSKLRQNVNAQHTKYTYILIPNGQSYSTVLARAYTSTLKAMFFLIPLFGVPFILTANRNIVNTNSCSAGDVYYYVSYSIQALQSVMVALLFCYWNNEVHQQIKGTIRKTNLFFQARFRLNCNRDEIAIRRETAATYVHHHMSPLKMEIPMENMNRVQDWLAELPSVHETKSDQLGEVSVHFPQEHRLSKRVSRYIDDSNEDLQKSNRKVDNFDN